jgi:histidinol-phosphate aminotransferase
MFFNKYISGLVSYKVSTHKAWESKNKNEVLKLDWNESTIPPSPMVKSALLDYAQNGLMNWYPDVDNQKLRKMLADYSNVNTDQVEYFASSDALHEYIIRAYINPGDVITMIAPTYDNFRAAAESIGAKVDYFTLDEDNDFKFEPEKFESHIEGVRPKIVYLCNPNNPTGSTYNIETIDFLLHRFNDVLFIIDEAYFEFTGITASSLSEKYENAVICRTFSKAFGLASFRVGYAISSVHNIEGLRKLRNPKNISSYAQIAAVSALTDLKYMVQYVSEVNKTKKDFIDNLSKLNVKVKGSIGGNFVLVAFGDLQVDIVNKLEEKHIFVRNYGHVHGMGKYTRITIGTSSQMKRVINVISQFYN